MSDDGFDKEFELSAPPTKAETNIEEAFRSQKTASKKQVKGIDKTEGEVEDQQDSKRLSVDCLQKDKQEQGNNKFVAFSLCLLFQFSRKIVIAV